MNGVVPYRGFRAAARELGMQVIRRATIMHLARCAHRAKRGYKPGFEPERKAKKRQVAGGVSTASRQSDFYTLEGT